MSSGGLGGLAVCTSAARHADASTVTAGVVERLREDGRAPTKAADEKFTKLLVWPHASCARNMAISDLSPNEDSSHSLHLETLEPFEQLQTLIAWFMADVGGAIASLTIHVRGTRGAAYGEVQLELGDVVSDWHAISNLDSIDVWAVMASFGLVPMRPERTFTTIEGQQPADSKALAYLERNATNKVSRGEADLLQRTEQCCAICQEPYTIGNTIMAMPCGAGISTAMHCGHKKCLTSWLRRADSCPLCRTVLPRRGEAGFLDTLQQAHARLRCFREEAERRGRQPARSTVRTSSSSSTSTTLASPSSAAQGGLLAAKGLGRAVSHAAAKKRDDDRLWRQAIGEATKGMRRGFGSASGGATAARMARRTAPLSTRSDQGAVAQSV